jgi:hypothetical protein
MTKENLPGDEIAKIKTAETPVYLATDSKVHVSGKIFDEKQHILPKF